MAVHGLRDLLNPHLELDTVSTSEQSSMKINVQQCLDSAILILPLINEYLRHYIEMVETTLDTSTATTSTTSTSSSSESFDTSSESPTGSVGQFLKTVAGFANDLESLCVAALHTLNELTSCEGIRCILLQTVAGQTTETCMETEVSFAETSGEVFLYVAMYYIALR